MKPIFYTLLLLMATSCKPSASMVATELQNTVAALSDDRMKGRLAGTPEELAAATLLAKKFEAIGLAPLPQASNFFQTFEADTKRGALQMQNVVGMVTGTQYPNEWLVISAHYDHIGILQSVNGDSIANGADDNASGVATMLWLAKQFSQNKPARSVIFAAFTAEEIGMFGSKHFASVINTDSIVAGINLEMLGKISKEGPNAFFMTGPDKSDLLPMMQQALLGTPYKIFADPYPKFNLFMRSDNASLAQKGVPAHTISTDQIDSDPYYHTVNDEVGTLDFEHLASVAQGIYTAILPLANTRVRPRLNNK